jgi:hypothetical protein
VYLSFFLEKKIFETRRTTTKMMPPIIHNPDITYPDLPVNMADWKSKQDNDQFLILASI